jgi:hypothetical protein
MEDNVFQCTVQVRSARAIIMMRAVLPTSGQCLRMGDTVQGGRAGVCVVLWIEV